MKVNGSYKLPADPDTVWETLLNPDALAKSIPGAKSFTPDGEDAYTVDLSIGVAAIKGNYSGRVVVADQHPVTSFRLDVEGKGAKGAVQGSAVFTLKQSKAGETEVAVDGEGQIAGLFSRVGQRMLGGVAKLLMKQFFGNMKKQVQARVKAAAND
ncbi:MAG: carbon monoxide dehydrogenase subunit G [Dehalococcoidia bacterium]